MVSIVGGRALIGGVLEEAVVTIDGPRIADITSSPSPGPIIGASGCLVLPGIVDIHGDAFERQMMPRPGVCFPLDMAFIDTDRQLVANGITTALHGLTWSWEPGLRGEDNAIAILDTVERLRPDLGADTRIHLRHETFNLDGEARILDWLAAGRIAALAFNDHMVSTIRDRERPLKLARMVERSGVTTDAFLAITNRAYARADEVPASIERLAAGARAAGVPILSHDDASPQDRIWYRGLGARIAEFPMTEATARVAAEAGDAIVFGAPNVVRGGSHTGCPSAAAMVANGLCSILASDYFYPALAAAPFILARAGILDIAQAWPLVAGNPAAALGMNDRGRIEPGLRADLVIIRADGQNPAIMATIAAGRLVHRDARLGSLT
jgi:alpha-D-ribose 1-methylphosphonate 5-triphosphate diphosphatase